MLQCNTHGSPNYALLQYFWQCLDSMYNGVPDKLSPGGLMQQPYVIAAQLLARMTKNNRVWYTNKNPVTPITFKFAKEKHVKDQ